MQVSTQVEHGPLRAVFSRRFMQRRQGEVQAVRGACGVSVTSCTAGENLVLMVDRHPPHVPESGVDMTLHVRELLPHEMWPRAATVKLTGK